MFLRQKLNERKWIKQKISELKKSAYVFTEHQDDILQQLIKTFDRLQTINLILNKVNTESIIEIAGTKLNLNTAVELRSTMQSKIDIISELIALNNGRLDVLSLMKQRDELIDEHYTMDSAISKADRTIRID